MDYLDKEEKKVIESYENDEWHSIRKEGQETYQSCKEELTQE